jgi:hypothetical protein
MLSEIILFQILYRLLKNLFFFTCESEYNKIYLMWAMFLSMVQNSHKFDFKKKLDYNNAFGSCHIHSFIHISTYKAFVIKILGQKNLFRRSL